MNKTLIKITAMTLILGMASIANAQNWSLSGNALSGISPLKLGSTDTEDVKFFTDDQFRMNLTKLGWLGLGIDQPRGWMEVNYCPPPGQDDNGLIVTRNYCNSHILVDAGLPDNIGAGVVLWNPNNPPEGNNNFTVPFSFRTGNTTNVSSPLLNPDAAPMFWVRKQSPNGFFQSSGPDKFDTKFIVLPDGSCGINVVQPRAALDVRGSNVKNRPAAIFGSRALGTHYIDPITGTMSYYTQQAMFVPVLKENGYNRIVQADDQGMFFTDGKGADGANLASAFVIAPWVEGNNSNKGGMRMDANGNTDFHGTLRATKVNVDAKWWSDFVFADDYKLPSLAEVEAFIATNKHLPNVPSEAEVLENGIDVANMQAIQQQKIEELTLYIIQLKKEMDAMKAAMELLKQ
jgi:hypothetical protein